MARHALATHDHADLQAAPAEAQPELQEEQAPASPMAVPLLKVGHVSDDAESHADELADRALARLGSSDGGAHGEAGHVHTEGDEVRRAPAESAPSVAPTIGAAGGEVTPDFQARVDARRGAGSPLGGKVKGRMEQAFGRSFGGVRIHHDHEAGRMSESISARAFTTGNDVYFGRGQFSPDTADGERVLAHELGHVVQGGSGVGRMAQGSIRRNPLSGLGNKIKGLFTKKPKTPEEEEKKKNQEKSKESWAKEKDDLKEKQKVNSQAREAMKENVKDTSTGTTGTTTVKKTVTQQDGKKLTEDVQEDRQHTKGQDYINSLNKRFDDNLKYEQELLIKAKSMTKRDGTPVYSDEEAVTYAYDIAWTKTKDKELYNVRPPRETAAERMMAAIRKLRDEDMWGVIEQTKDQSGKVVSEKIVSEGKYQEEGAKLGKLLPDEVEKVYEAWEKRFQELVTANNAKEPANREDPNKLDAQAEKETWAAATPEVQAKRPEDPRIEREARKQAKFRMQVRFVKPAPPPKTKSEKQNEKLDKAGETTEKVNTGVEVGEKVTGGIGKILEKVGDKKNESSTSYKGGTLDDVGPSNIVEKALPSSELDKSIREVQFRKDNNLKDDSQLNDATGKSNETLASEGMESSVGIIKDLVGLVQGIIASAKGVKKAAESGTHEDRIEATKSVTTNVDSVMSLGTHAAELAKTISSSVKDGVDSVIPGFNIVSTIMAMIRAALDLGVHSKKMDDTNKAITAARSRKAQGGGMSGVDVMLYPLWHMHEGWVKQLEKSVWTTVVSVSNFTTSLVTVVGGGAFGVPAAVQAGVGLLDKLHSAAHFIADEVITYIGKKAVEAETQREEGGAEQRLKRDPAAAVDAIIVRAQNGDVVAKNWLNSMGVDDKDFAKGARLTKVRQAVLSQFGEKEELAFAYEAYAEKAKGLKEKWKQTGEMKTHRNSEGEKGKSDRGTGWRMKKMIESFFKEDQFKRSVAKSEAQKGGSTGVLIRVGKAILMADSTPNERDRFLAQLEKESDADITKAMNDPKATPEVIKLLSEFLVERLKKKVPSGQGQSGNP